MAEEVGRRVEEFRKRFAALRVRAAEAFELSADSLQAERFGKRMRMAERTCEFVLREVRRGTGDGCGFAERGLADLDVFAESFEDELRLWADNPQNPKVKATVIDAGDFGLKGDGKTDACEPLQRALKAVRARCGLPTELRLPEGTLLFKSVPGDGRTAQLDVRGVTNCVIAGAGSRRTQMVFGVYAARGVFFEDCLNTTLDGVELTLEKIPFLQGEVLTNEVARDAVVIRHRPGTLLPNDPEWKKQQAGRVEQYCGQVFDARTKRMYSQASSNFYTGDCESIGDGVWRLFFVNSPAYTHRNMRPGQILAIPNRLNNIPITGARISPFLTFHDVVVRTSRCNAFGSYLSPMTAYSHCRVVPFEGLYMSSNADAVYSSRSTYIAHGEFANAADDGYNIHSHGVRPKCGGSAGEAFLASGGVGLKGLMLLVDCTTGKMRNLRPEDPLPEGVDLAKTVLYSPDFDGVGPVVSDSAFVACRGGLVLQSPNALIEDVRGIDLPGGIQAGCLSFCKEGTVPYNCLFSRVEFADHRWQGFHSNFHIRGFYRLAECAPIRGLLWEDCKVTNGTGYPVWVGNLADSEFRRLTIRGELPKNPPVSFRRCEDVRFVDCTAGGLPLKPLCRGTATKTLDDTTTFESAAPVWLEGLSTTSNVFVRFSAKFDYDGGECPLLRLTASTVYRANPNGKIVGYGPARAAKGFFRVDEWPLRDVRVGKNELTVEVAGYCLDTFQYAPQHSFLQAEVVAGGRTVLATPTGWTATRIARAREGDPYSMQRGFPHESYVVMGAQAKAEGVSLGVTPPVRYLPREVPYPEFKVNTTFEPCPAKGRGQVYAAKGVDTGFAGVKVNVTKPGKVVLEFEERLTDGALDPFRTGYPTNRWHFVVNRVEWDVRTPGEYVLETFEPYTFKYATAYFDGGEGVLSAPYLIQYRNPLPERARYMGSDPELRAIFDAATSTLAQNAVDIFTDCPSRERSGWLCDSWFSSQAMAALTGDRSLERTMLEGMAGGQTSASGPVKSPMTGGFPKASNCMPTYMMWYVIQCAEYAEHAGADAGRFKERVRNRILSNFLFFRDYLNADGLLEDLPGWVFIEWSHANDLTKGVNYPANMMYAKALDAAARMYGLPECAKEAAAVRAKIREQAFDGTWFHDQAVRRDGKLELVRDCTEICQYYAFFTDTATHECDAELARRVVETFRPGCELPPGLYSADMFIGYMLRLRVLKDLGREDLIPGEIKARVGYQVGETGSLWEFRDGHDSCCHGFVSYVATFLPFAR